MPARKQPRHQQEQMVAVAAGLVLKAVADHLVLPAPAALA
jgi:hypothetical protein